MIEPPLPDPAPVRSPGSTRLVFERLERCGLDAVQAGNLTARLAGLEPVRDGWTVEEIDRILFLRWLDGCGRIDASVPPLQPPAQPPATG